MLSPNLWSKIFPFTKRSGLRIFSGGGGGGSHFTFWCWVQICGQKFFPLPSALDLEFFLGGGGSHFYFLMLSPNLWSKIFPFTKHSGLRIFSGGGGGSHFYFLMLSPNLWSKIFPFTKRSGLRIFGGGGGHTLLFDAESKSVVKNFSLYQALWT